MKSDIVIGNFLIEEICKTENVTNDFIKLPLKKLTIFDKNLNNKLKEKENACTSFSISQIVDFENTYKSLDIHRENGNIIINPNVSLDCLHQYFRIGLSTNAIDCIKSAALIS